MNPIKCRPPVKKADFQIFLARSGDLLTGCRLLPNGFQGNE